MASNCAARHSEYSELLLPTKRANGVSLARKRWGFICAGFHSNAGILQ